jgi:hypothetical protein
MFVMPWWALLVVIVVLVYLMVRVIELSRRSRKLHNMVARLEGTQNGEGKEKFKDTEQGGFEEGA